jgi:hypothetical protein
VGESIEEVSTMIADVSKAAGRQSQEIDQLSRSIGELDRLTESNTRMVGSWTDRAGHLRAELQRLSGLVQRFRLPQGSGVGDAVQGFAPRMALGGVSAPAAIKSTAAVATTSS